MMNEGWYVLFDNRLDTFHTNIQSAIRRMKYIVSRHGPGRTEIKTKVEVDGEK